MLARRLPTWLLGAIAGALLAAGVFQIHLTDLIVRHRDAIATDRALLLGLGTLVALHAMAGVPLGWLTTRILRLSRRRVRPFLQFAIWLVVLTSLGNGFLLVQAPAQHVSAPIGAAAVASDAPNVILLVADSLRRDVFDDPVQAATIAPNLMEFAAQATEFTQHQAVSSWTPPSMAGMLTGVFPGAMSAHHGVVPSSAVTLAERLRGHGYETVGISDNYLTHPRFGFAQGHDEYWQENNCILFSDLWFAERIFPSIYQWLVRRLGLQYAGAARVDAQVQDWLDRRDTRRPFYLMVHLMDTHYPYYVYRDPQNLSRRARPEDFVPYWKVMLEARGRRKPPFADLTLPAAQRNNLWMRYLGSVQVVDRYVGRWLDRLRASGEWDNTMVIFTADHGEEFFEHNYLGHGRSLYQESTRVPLWIKWPEQTSASTIEAPVSMLQIFPTVIQAIGAKGSDTYLPPLPRRSSGPGYPTYAEFFRAGVRMYGVRDGELKLTQTTRPNGHQVMEFYDLASDPQEQTNLIWENTPPPAELQVRLDTFVASVTPMEDGPVASEKRRRALRALGYVE